MDSHMNWARAQRVACIAGSLVLFACSERSGSGTVRSLSAALPVSEQGPELWECELPADAHLLGARERDLDFRMTVDIRGNRTTRLDEIPRRGFQATVIEVSESAPGRFEISTARRDDAFDVCDIGILCTGDCESAISSFEKAATARLKEDFYSAHRKSGRAAEASRIAQLRTRSEPTNAVWSSFVVRANERS
jgi:hypothetical protein